MKTFSRRLVLALIVSQVLTLFVGWRVYSATETCNVGFPSVAMGARCTLWVALTGEDQ